VRNIPVARRAAIAVIALAIAGYILRPQISQALVLRGDDRFYRGSAVDALRYYRRAVAIDPNDASALDRYLFGALSLRDRNCAHDGVALATEYLRRHPADDAVRMDRAMAFRLLADWNGALGDFYRVGVRKRDPAALTFAGYAALSLGRHRQACAMWRLALAFDPAFRAARHALATHGSAS
jgi:tetratricopeptide (TPR) repeat protein